MTADRPADFAQRMRALDPAGSFLCEAPAGSGKTELLSQRYLTLLGGVSRPEELLAITFTRKATAAMRDRIINALLLAKQGPEPEDEYQRITWRAARAALAADAAHGWDLLSNPGRLQIRTFDSFCVQLNGALPLHSTFGALPEVTDDPQQLYREAVHQLFLDLETDAGWAGDLAVVLRHLDNNFQSLEQLLIRLLRRREEWLPLIDRGAHRDEIRARLQQHLQHVCDEIVAHLEQLIPVALQPELLDHARFAAANLLRSGTESAIQQCRDLTADRLPDSSAAGMGQWYGILELLTTKQGQWRSALTKRNGFPAGDSKADKKLYAGRKEQMTILINTLGRQAGLLEAFQDLRQAPSVVYTDDQLEILQAVTAILPMLAAHLILVFRERNCVDFTEMNIRARTALGDQEAPTDLALALDYRIRHVLVDEFQDVSTAQFELLQLLTSGWQPGDGHTLFCVGDAMQSIYGFRDANVGVFIHCEEHGLGNIPLEYIRLNTNFRSRPGIVSWINKIFTPVFPAQNEISSGAVKYSPCVAYDQEDSSVAVQVSAFTGAGAEAAEAREVLDIIAAARGENAEATIAILVRSRSHAAHIVPLLKAAGIRYRAVELESLAEHVVIQDLMSLYRALVHPADRIAWLSVLRAPWCGLKLADLLAVTEAGGNGMTLIEQLQWCRDATGSGGGRQQLSADGEARLARVVPVLERAVHERVRKPLRQWLEGTWLELGGPACLDDPADLDNAEMFFSLIESLDTGRPASLDRLGEAVAGLFAAPDPAADVTLQVMTIHKAKGLEFDVVIVPSLQRKPRSGDPELLLWQERLTAGGGREVLMAPIPARGEEQDRNYEYLRAERRKREAFETCRLLYVACTRARRSLYLLAGLKRDPTTSLPRPPARSSLLHAVWDTVQPEIGWLVVPAQTGSPGPGGPPARLLRRLPAGWQLPQLPVRNLLPGYAGDTAGTEYPAADEQEAEAGIYEPGWQDPTARAVGTVVHQILQETGRQGLEFWDRTGREQGRPYWQARLATLGVPSANIGQACDAIYEVMAAVMQDDRLRRLFADNQVLRHSEYPVTVVHGRSFKHLVMDLLVQDRDGSTWIIDYKTGRPGPDESEDEFIRARMESYRKTMGLYRHAAEQMGYSKVRPVLYFPLLGRWVEYGEA